MVKTINTNNCYTMAGYSVPYIILPFVQCEVQSGYSKHACLFIDQRLLVPTGDDLVT